MCNVVVYHESGEELGILRAQGAWGQTVHTREMRKQINALRDSGEIVVGYQDNPVVILLNYLGSETHKEAEKKPLKISRSATRLARAADASGLPVVSLAVPDTLAATSPTLPPVLTVVPAAGPQPATRALSILIKPPQWKTVIR